jgi:hypothetical protein
LRKWHGRETGFPARDWAVKVLLVKCAARLTPFSGQDGWAI